MKEHETRFQFKTSIFGQALQTFQYTTTEGIQVTRTVETLKHRYFISIWSHLKNKVLKLYNILNGIQLFKESQKKIIFNSTSIISKTKLVTWQYKYNNCILFIPMQSLLIFSILQNINQSQKIFFYPFKFWFHEEPSKNQIQNGSRMVLVHPITNHQSNNLVDQQKLNSKFQESICLFKEIRFNSIWFYITEVVGNCTKWPTRSFIYNFTKSLMKRKQVHTELFPSVYLKFTQEGLA